MTEVPGSIYALCIVFIFIQVAMTTLAYNYRQTINSVWISIIVGGLTTIILIPYILEAFGGCLA